MRKQYTVHYNESGEIACEGTFYSKSDAFDALQDFITDINAGVDENNEDYLTPFDFHLESVDEREPEDYIKDFKDAQEYLGLSDNENFDVIKRKEFECESFVLQEMTTLIKEANPYLLKLLIDVNRLCTIAIAWNSHDEFCPDFSDESQSKWIPYYRYNQQKEVIEFSKARFAGYKNMFTHLFPLIAFKSEERAEQFGKLFNCLL